MSEQPPRLRPILIGRVESDHHKQKKIVDHKEACLEVIKRSFPNLWSTLNDPSYTLNDQECYATIVHWLELRWNWAMGSLNKNLSKAAWEKLKPILIAELNTKGVDHKIDVKKSRSPLALPPVKRRIDIG
jgi:hypothetical protein